MTRSFQKLLRGWVTPPVPARTGPPPSAPVAPVSNRLLEYEAWARVQARGFGSTHSEFLGAILGRLAYLELTRPVLARTLEPFPVAVRTLDVLRLASIEFLRERGQEVRLAAYDKSMLEAADRMGIAVIVLP